MTSHAVTKALKWSNWQNKGSATCVFIDDNFEIQPPVVENFGIKFFLNYAFSRVLRLIFLLFIIIIIIISCRGNSSIFSLVLVLLLFIFTHLSNEKLVFAIFFLNPYALLFVFHSRCSADPTHLLYQGGELQQRAGPLGASY